MKGRWMHPYELKPGMRIRHESKQYAAGETVLTVRDDPYYDGGSWMRIPVCEWNHWTLRVRAAGAVRVVGQTPLTKPERR